jgi:predicted transcriptional regulator
MATKQNRDSLMTVKLTAEMKEKLEFVAQALGQAPATVASLAVGQFVATQMASLKASTTHAETLTDALIPQLAELFKNLKPESE